MENKILPYLRIIYLKPKVQLLLHMYDKLQEISIFSSIIIINFGLSGNYSKRVDFSLTGRIGISFFTVTKVSLLCAPLVHLPLPRPMYLPSTFFFAFSLLFFPLSFLFVFLFFFLGQLIYFCMAGGKCMSQLCMWNLN